MNTIIQPWPPIRAFHLRPDTSDQRVLEDAMAGYHVPPEMIRPLTILDLGANIGVTAAHYQYLYPDARIVAVEMNPNTAEVCKLNTEAQVVVGAVASHAGMRSWDHASDAEANRLDPDGLAMTPAMTLDGLVNRYLNGHCDFCKMDVEGAEWELLAVGETWAPLIDSLLVELHPHGAPDAPLKPWPPGRDGPSPLVAAAVRPLSRLGYRAVPHTLHPHAIWAVRA